MLRLRVDPLRLRVDLLRLRVDLLRRLGLDLLCDLRRLHFLRLGFDLDLPPRKEAVILESVVHGRKRGSVKRAASDSPLARLLAPADVPSSLPLKNLCRFKLNPAFNASLYGTAYTCKLMKSSSSAARLK